MLYCVTTNRWFLAFAILVAVSARVCGDSTGEQFRVALDHYTAERWEQAARDFSALIDAFPDDPRVSNAKFYCGESLMQAGKFETAVAAFQDFVFGNPNHKYAARGHFRWAESLLFSGELPASHELFSQFLQRYPNHSLNEFTFVYLGLIAKNRNELVEAEARFQDAIRKFPNGRLASEAHLRLAVMDFNKKAYTSARQHFNWLEANTLSKSKRAQARYWSGIVHLAERNYSQAASELDSVAQLDPENEFAAAATYHSGEGYRMSEQFDLARLAYKNCAAKWPQSEWRDDCQCGLIEVALRQNEFAVVEQLLADFEKESSDSDRLVDALQASGQALLQQEKWLEATSHFDRALQQLGQQTESQSRRNALTYLSGVGYLGADQPQQALDRLDEIKEFDPASKFGSRVTFVRGAALADLNRSAEAIEVLRSTIQTMEPGVTADRCRAKLASSLSKAGDFDEVLQVISQISATNDEAILKSIHRIAEELYKQQQFQQAMPPFEKLAQSQSAAWRENGLSGIAWCHQQMENYAMAASTFEKLATEFPKSESADKAMFLSGRARELAGQADIAIGVYANTRRLYANGPFAAEATFLEAKLESKRNRPHVAIQLYQDLIAQHPDYQRLDAAIYELAWLYRQAGQLSESEQLFARLHRDFQESELWSDATYRLAESNFERNEFEQTEQRLAPLLTGDRNDEVTPYASLLKARVAVAQKKWSAAIEPLEHLLEHHEQHQVAKDARRWLAEAYFRTKNYTQADRVYSVLLQLPDASTSSWWPIARLRKAQALVADQQWREAIEAAKLLIEQDPDFPQRQEAEYLIGRSLAGIGRFQEARRYYKRAIEQAQGNLETNAKAHVMIGESYFHQKNYHAAIESFLRVETIYDFPDWTAAALLQAAKCHEMLGAQDAAARLYQRITNDLPNSAQSNDAASRLQAIKHTTSKTISVNKKRTPNEIE